MSHVTEVPRSDMQLGNRAHYEDLIRQGQKVGESGTCYAGGFPFALLPDIQNPLDSEESSSAIRKHIHFGPFPMRPIPSFCLLTPIPNGYQA